MLSLRWLISLSASLSTLLFGNFHVFVAADDAGVVADDADG